MDFPAGWPKGGEGLRTGDHVNYPVYPRRVRGHPTPARLDLTGVAPGAVGSLPTRSPRASGRVRGRSYDSRSVARKHGFCIRHVPDWNVCGHAVDESRGRRQHADAHRGEISVRRARARDAAQSALCPTPCYASPGTGDATLAIGQPVRSCVPFFARPPPVSGKRSSGANPAAGESHSVSGAISPERSTMSTEGRCR